MNRAAATGPEASAAEALEGRLAHAAAGLPPVVCFANDWHGDPTSKHHIMRILGRHVPVLWVESSGMRRPNLGNTQDLKRIVARLGRAAGLRGGPERPAPAPPDGPRVQGAGGTGGVRVISPLGVPLPGNALAEKVNARLYQRAVQAALPAGPDPLLWVYTPTVAPYLDDIPHSGLVYHCVDRWWAFSEYDGAVMRRHHEALCRRADVVFASATELLEDCRQFAPDAILMRHGVDWDHFSTAAFQTLERPADIRDIRTPILGFFGLLHDWIDQELLVRLARSRHDTTMVLIGKAPVDISRLTAEPNIRWLGQKPFSQLPAYAAAFDVALVPFVRNDLTAAVNPIKLLEYLSAGVPVVATALPEIALMAPRTGLHVANTAEDFVRMAGAALEGAEGLDRTAISTAQREESWAGRCVHMLEVVSTTT